MHKSSRRVRGLMTTHRCVPVPEYIAGLEHQRDLVLDAHAQTGYGSSLARWQRRAEGHRALLQHPQRHSHNHVPAQIPARQLCPRLSLFLFLASD